MDVVNKNMDRLTNGKSAYNKYKKIMYTPQNCP